MSEPQIKTDEEIRLDYLCESGLNPIQAHEHIKNNAPGVGESFAIAARRMSELGTAISSVFLSDIKKVTDILKSRKEK